MNLIFKEITKENWEECIELKVSKEQENFVASNTYSLLEASFSDSLYPLAIYNVETMVGFLMYEKDDVAKDMGMCRLMIDTKYQNKGYGKAAIIKLLDFIREKYGSTPFYTSFEPENIVAEKLYESIGFIKTGKMLGEEILLKIDL
ncbi:GNAT family N-acetyltransferase [Brassicibacter mesophilus]|uniref:GNAT family N-acetyltransferase n=1 Tax=Brassicibacter mesophilus TaxID=745119 RepID=UPI003D25F34D